MYALTAATVRELTLSKVTTTRAHTLILCSIPDHNILSIIKKKKLYTEAHQQQQGKKWKQPERDGKNEKIL